MSSSDLTAFFGDLGAWVAEHSPPVELHTYGPHPDQHAELRLPAGPGPHPVAVVLHGGFWRAVYTKSNTAAIATALTLTGFATWNVEYRRVGSGGGYPVTLADIADARRALDAIDVPLDLGRVISIGHSAGGQLSLWLAAERRVRTAVSLAGVCDLTAAAHAGLGDDAVVEFLGGGPDDVPDAYDVADPSRRDLHDVPLLLVHGTADDRVPVEQSRALASVADAARLLVLENVDHLDVIDPRTPAWAAIAPAIDALAI